MPQTPIDVQMKGPVLAQLDAKGRLGVDVTVTADRGLRVSQTGVDRSGAPDLIGDTGVSVLSPM
ncbi:hypothetical protein KNO81_39270 [Paraburkholderia sediminicola]|nr:hypothetical protein [Paraburkholderia sediminicola]